jgi:hypothetical protein
MFHFRFLSEMDRNATTMAAMRSARLARLSGGYNPTPVPNPMVEIPISPHIESTHVERPRSLYTESSPYQIRHRVPVPKDTHVTVRQLTMQRRRQPCKRKHMDGMRRAVGDVSQLNAEFHRRLGGMAKSGREEHFVGGLQEKEVSTRQNRKVGIHGL